MLTIDTQILIYYFDTHSKEHINIKSWVEDILITEEIYLSSIIPIEVAHSLFSIRDKKKSLDLNKIEQTLIAFVSLKNCQIIEVNQVLIVNAIKFLKNYRKTGIGGRDSLIVASMNKVGIKTLASHDKNLLNLSHLKRIDPVFDPPLHLDIGEKLDLKDFKERIKQL